MSEKKLVNWEKEASLGIITVNNPPANAFSVPVMKEMIVCLEEIEADKDVRVAIITGSGTKIFIGGADIKSFPSLMNGDIKLARELSAQCDVVCRAISGFSKPVIAALNGAALGGGLELALSCDMRVASPTIKIGLPEITLGLIPGAGGTQRLPRLIGYARALEMMLTGKPISAEEALLIGLINQIAPSQAEILTAAKKLALEIAEYASETINTIKFVVNNGLKVSLEEAILLERDCFSKTFKSPVAREGINAFLEKRKPDFSKSLL